MTSIFCCSYKLSPRIVNLTVREKALILDLHMQLSSPFTGFVDKTYLC